MACLGVLGPSIADIVQCMYRPIVRMYVLLCAVVRTLLCCTSEYPRLRARTRTRGTAPGRVVRVLSCVA